MKIDLNRLVRLGTISPKNNNIFLKNIIELIKKDNKSPIILVISSNGGSVDAGFGIYDAVKSIIRPSLLYTIGVGNVDSMAILLFAMGEKRFVTPNTTLFFHEFGRILERDRRFTSSDLISFGTDLRKRELIYAEIIARSTDGKISTKKILSFMKKGRSEIHAKEAVKIGLAEMIDEKFNFSF